MTHQPPRLSRASGLLRTEFYPTLHRETTDKVVLAYTGHVPDNRIDAIFLDNADCMKGYFGCSHHYVVKTEGGIEIGRNPLTRSSRTRSRRLQRTALFVGIVGGLSATTGYRVNSITEAQTASIEWLLQELADNLGVPLEVIDHAATWGDSRKLEGVRAQNDELLASLYGEMTEAELAASPDRLKA